MFSRSRRSNPIADFLLGIIRKRSNPQFGRPDAREMFRIFHWNPSSKSRTVEVPDTPSELFVIGRVPEIQYIPYGSSGKEHVIYIHKFGDYGDGVHKFDKDHMPLLCADDQDNLFIVKDRASFRNEARGIVG